MFYIARLIKKTFPREGGGGMARPLPNMNVKSVTKLDIDLILDGSSFIFLITASCWSDPPLATWDTASLLHFSCCQAAQN